MTAARAAAAVVLAAVLLAACGGDDNGGDDAAKQAAPTIRLGTKNFTEQYILGELYRQALRARGYKVELKENVGSSEIIDSALTIGSLDMYPEYIGTVLSEIAKQRKRPTSKADAYQRAKAFQEGRGFTLLAPTPFANSNALAVKPAFARRYDLRTIDDLARVPRTVTIAAPPEYRTRFEGLMGLQKVYGLNNVKVRATPIGEQYKALDDGDVDAANVFTTDGQLRAGAYTVLRDSRGLFGYQNVAPVISNKLRKAAPGAERAINEVSALLSTSAMREMNAAVDLNGEKPADVAAAFLRSHGLS